MRGVSWTMWLLGVPALVAGAIAGISRATGAVTLSIALPVVALLLGGAAVAVTPRPAAAA